MSHTRPMLSVEKIDDVLWRLREGDADPRQKNRHAPKGGLGERRFMALDRLRRMGLLRPAACQ